MMRMIMPGRNNCRQFRSGEVVDSVVGWLEDDKRTRTQAERVPCPDS